MVSTEALELLLLSEWRWEDQKKKNPDPSKMIEEKNAMFSTVQEEFLKFPYPQTLLSDEVEQSHMFGVRNKRKGMFCQSVMSLLLRRTSLFSPDSSGTREHGAGPGLFCSWLLFALYSSSLLHSHLFLFNLTVKFYGTCWFQYDFCNWRWFNLNGGIHTGIIRSNVAYNLYLDMVLVLAAGYKTVQIKCKKILRLNINDIQVSKKTVV